MVLSLIDLFMDSGPWTHHANLYYDYGILLNKEPARQGWDITIVNFFYFFCWTVYAPLT